MSGLKHIITDIKQGKLPIEKIDNVLFYCVFSGYDELFKLINYVLDIKKLSAIDLCI